MTEVRTTPQAALRRGLLAGGLALLTCLLAQLVSAGLARDLLVWPAAGVAMAFGWRYGRLWIVPAAIGALVWGLLATRDPVFALAVGIASMPGPALAIHCLQRIGQWKPPAYRLDAIVRLVVVTLGIAAPLGATTFTVADLAFAVGGKPQASAFDVWFTVWLIDGLGLLLFAPALLTRVGSGNDDSPRRSRSDDLEVLPWPDLPATAAAVGLAVPGLLFLEPTQAAYAALVPFGLFPVLAWSALRVDERVNAMTLLVASLAVLAARAWPAATATGLPPATLLQTSAIALSAVIMAMLLQALAADRRLALQQAIRQAREDMSTGLLNDRGLLAELSDRLGAPDRVNHGLIGLHITNFDAINDLCGSLDAMQLEQSTAQLLLHQERLQFAARLSAGRYALLVDADTVSRTRATAREIYAQLNGQIFHTEHGSIRLQCCVGGLLLDAHTLISSEDCLSSLGDALAIAASVRDPQLFVEPLSQMMIDARRAHQNKIEHIREAIRDNRIELYAQPLLDPDAPPDMVSCEILTRLRDRDGELVRPPEFMSLAGQAQMSIPLDRAVIRRTFEWLAAHPEQLRRTWKCSINLAGATMSDGTIADFIREHRALHDIPADRIVFEITEGEAIRNPAAATRLVDDLKLQGFGIALDDFGTGLATFEYLKRFPLDYLKIDGSFIRNLLSNPIDEEIVLSTIRVARRLKLRTIAEHVHSAAIYERLTDMGVRHLQGDYFGQAMPLAEVFKGPALSSRPAVVAGSSAAVTPEA